MMYGVPHAIQAHGHCWIGECVVVFEVWMFILLLLVLVSPLSFPVKSTPPRVQCLSIFTLFGPVRVGHPLWLGQWVFKY